MSISQTLVSSQYGLDLFAPSWQAGLSGSQCLSKSLRKYDIESINVAKTCEKLCLALNETSQCISKDDEKQCSVAKPHIPFRAISNIWFGTLKIYHQQVNSLLRLSQDLCSRSCNYDVKHLEASKRKSSFTSHKQVKKRRLTLSETKYTKLLDDFERLIQEPVQKSLEEPFSSTITEYQIREITIREISATTYNAPDAVDEDSGFGEATHEEIAEFFNFVEDNTMSNSNKRTPAKRKSMCGQESPIKKGCFINDLSIEPQDNTPLNNDILSASPVKRSIDRTHVYNTFDKRTMEKTNILQQNGDFIETNKIKKEGMWVIERKPIAKIMEAKKKISNLIIDECTKIEMSEIIEEMKNFECLAKTSRRNVFKAYKSKRNKTALELLTRFNRRSINLSLSLKQKFYVSREQFEKDYLNLLREIFKINYNEKWASEIYPKWIVFEDALQKRAKKQRLNKSRKQKADKKCNANTNKMNDYDFSEYQEVTPTTVDHSNMKTYNTWSYNDWRPYSVMEKLLNLWRFNQTNKIAAITLFKLAENQINRALGFNSLLNLSKKQFVNLTTFPESIELQNILIGKLIRSNFT